MGREPGPMPERQLGRSGIRIPRVAVGTAPLGNLHAAVTDDAAVETIGAAWDAGVRMFDTAPHYGLGLAERRLGEAFRQLGLPRHEAVICTKVGRVLEPLDRADGEDAEGFVVPRTHVRRWDFTAAGVARSLRDSRERLGVDRIDIALLHDPDTSGNEESMRAAISQAYPELARLRAAGELRAIGAGMNSATALARVVAACDLDVVLLAGRYSLLDQSALDSVLPLALDRGTAVLVGGVFNSGLLAQATPQEGATYDYAPASAELLGRARSIAATCAEYGVTLPQVALQFPLAHPAVAGVVVGTRSASEVRVDLALAAAPIPAALWARLRDTGVLRPDAPVPS
ncbi:MAG: fdh [Frankiales bacterium]|nr:fdh [Frankiales bacterium]